MEATQDPPAPAVLDRRLSGALPAGATNCDFFRTQAWLCYRRGHPLHCPRLPAEGAHLSRFAFLSLAERIQVACARLRHRILKSPMKQFPQHPTACFKVQELVPFRFKAKKKRHPCISLSSCRETRTETSSLIESSVS